MSRPQVQPPPVPATRTVASLTEIGGEWDIVSFDGHSPPRLDSEGKRHFYGDIGPQGLRFAIGCNHSGMPGRIEGGVLHAEPTDDGVQTAMGCGSERETRDAAFFAFFRSRPQVTLLPGGRLRMASPGHELLLERSSVRRLAMGPALSEITGSWRVVSFMRLEGGGYHGWGAMYAPGRLRIGEGTLSYNRCPAASVRFTYTSDFVLRREDGGEPRTAVQCPEVAPVPTEVETMLGALLGQSPEAERINDARFILRSRDYAVVLTGEADYQREFGHSADEWERNPG
jgi:heat shock protein HslJ